MASIGSIMEETPGELLKMLPPERFSDENFNGKFTFNFFVHGKPTEVVIDDRLPTKDGELIFCGSKSNEAEFWPSLVEKAFAKLHGGYDKIEGGQASEGLKTIADMLTETLEVADCDNEEIHTERLEI